MKKLLILFILNAYFVSGQNPRYTQEVIYNLNEEQVLRHNEVRMVFTMGPTPVIIIDSTYGKNTYTRLIVGSSIYGPVHSGDLWESQDGLYNLKTDSGRYTLDVYSNTFFNSGNGFDHPVYGSGWYPYSKALRKVKQTENGYINYLSYPDGTLYGPYKWVVAISKKQTRNLVMQKMYTTEMWEWNGNQSIDSIPNSKELFKRFIYKTDQGNYLYDNGKTYGPYKEEMYYEMRNDHWTISLSPFGTDSSYHVTSFGDTIFNTWNFHIHSNGSWGVLKKSDSEVFKNESVKLKYHRSHKQVSYYHTSEGKVFGPLYKPAVFYKNGKTVVTHQKVTFKHKRGNDTTFFMPSKPFKQAKFQIVDGKKRKSKPVGTTSTRKSIELTKGHYSSLLLQNDKKVASYSRGKAGFIGKSSSWYAFENFIDGGCVLKLSNGHKIELNNSYTGYDFKGYNDNTYMFKYCDNSYTTFYTYLSVLDSTITSSGKLTNGRNYLSKNGKHYAFYPSSFNQNIVIDNIKFPAGFNLCYNEKEDAFFWISIEGNTLILNRYNCKDKE